MTSVNAENRRSSAEKDNVRWSLDEQVKLLFSEMKALKDAQNKVSDDLYTWENRPDFNPATKNMTANRWLKLFEQKDYFLRWDEVTVMRNVVDKLAGRAREWFLTSGFTGISWNDFKKYFREIYDIDPQSIGTLFKSASMFSSSEEKHLVRYFHKKLTLLMRLKLAGSSWQPLGTTMNLISLF